MLVHVNAEHIKSVCDRIIAHITGEHEKTDTKHLDDIKSRYRADKKRLWGLLGVRKGVEITTKEAIEVAEEIAHESWRATWKDTRWNKWLSRARSLRKACTQSLETGNGMIGLDVKDIQLMRWWEDDWDVENETFGD